MVDKIFEAGSGDQLLLSQFHQHLNTFKQLKDGDNIAQSSIRDSAISAVFLLNIFADVLDPPLSAEILSMCESLTTNYGDTLRDPDGLGSMQRHITHMIEDTASGIA